MGEENTLLELPDDDATRAETPEARIASSGAVPVAGGAVTSPSSSVADPEPGASSVTMATTPVETLLVEEIGRTRIFVRYAAAMSIAVAGLSTMVAGDPIAKRILLSGLSAVVLACAWLGWRLRTDAGYTVRRALIAAAACVAGAFCSIWFFGVFSPAVVVLPFGIYFFSAAQNFRATLVVFGTCVALYFALCVAVWSGLLVDRGVIRGDSLEAGARLVVLAVVEVTLLATYLVARSARRAQLRAIELHAVAVREISQREALLEEARLDLQQALRSGGLGRFTDTLLGSFRLGKLLGRGAMGEVYEANRTGTNEVAAVKLLQAHVLTNPTLVRRFLREAKIAASLDVPNVVRVLEIGGPDSANRAPFPYIAMERLRGEDLGEHLRKHRHLSIARTIALIREVGCGLDAARGAGIVHRDIKPRNLFYAEAAGRHVWKILDFGVSKLLDAGDGDVTRDQIVGTPAYMAPEQATGGLVNHRTDLYALGVIAYRALTGRPAFTGDHTAEILFHVAFTMPPRPSHVTQLPAEVDLVLAIAMAKADGDRFDTARAFADALEAAARGVIEPDIRARAELLLANQAWGSASSAARVASADRAHRAPPSVRA